MNIHSIGLLIASVSALWTNDSFGNEPPKPDAPKVSFRASIAPILHDQCLACHSSKRAEGGYRVDTVEKFFTAGDSSEQPVAPESESLGEVFARLISPDPDVRMPAEHRPLKQPEIDLFKQWITQGAAVDVEDRNAQLWTILPAIDYPPPPEKYPQTIPITGIKFSADGKSLLTAGYHEVAVWQIDNGSLLRRINNQPKRINAIHLIDNNQQLLTGGGNPAKIGEVRLTNFESAKMEKALGRSTEMILSVTLRPNSSDIAIASGDTSIRIIDPIKGETKATFYSHADWVTDVAFNTDGTKLASSSLDKSCKVYDLSSNEVIANYSKHNNAVRAIDCLGDGSEWFSVGADNQLHKFKTEGAATVAAVKLPGEPTSFCIVENSIVVIQANKKLSIVNLADNKIAKTIDLDAEPMSMDYHKESQTLAIGHINGSVSLWKLPEGSKLKDFIAIPK